MLNQPLTQAFFHELPEGTVTFLFTDIEGSTQLLQRLRDRYAVLLADQRRILREAFTRWEGHEVDTQGDAFFVAFSRATQAVGAAVEAQQRLSEHIWPERVAVRVRMGIHTGESWSGETGYIGMDVHRAARIAHVGSGGQVLLSETTTALVRDELPQRIALLDLGRHLLKDIRRPERIHQLVIEGLQAEFPPLASLEALPAEGARQPRKVGECPYRGLAAFKEVDARFYFGRESFIDALEHAVRVRQLVAVIVGASGSGKSSALFAGLLPRLRKTGSFQFVIFRPGAQPYTSLAGALLPLLEGELGEVDRLTETRKLAERLMKDEISLDQVTGRILEKSARDSQLLLVIDQFEELYTLCAEVALQKSFVEKILATVAATPLQQTGPVVILITLRADFMGQALANRLFADVLQDASLLMGPMTRQELGMAIQNPAEMQGAAFEAGLVERILDDVGEKPGNLPLLEFTLTQLWETQSDGWLTHNHYEGMGGVEGALAAYADQVYDSLDPGLQERARHALVQLVQPGEGTEDTRRIATRSELGEKSWSLIHHLANRRLVVVGSDQAGQEVAEVVHEALIQRWGRFREWMDADRAFRVWQERLRMSLRQWQESGQDEGALLSGVPLLVAEDWLTEREAELSETEGQFIHRGIALREQRETEQEAQRQRELEAAQKLAESEGRRAEENARAARRLRRRALLLTGASIVAVILAVMAFFSFRQADENARAAQTASWHAEQQKALAEEQLLESTSRELAAASVSNLNVDPERSVLLALEALWRANTLEARNALHQALPELRILHSTAADNLVIYGVAHSPDGSRLATAGYDATGKIWDASSHQLLFSLVTDGADGKDVFDVQWSPDGTRLATSGITDVTIWDATTGKQIRTLPGETVGHTLGNFLGAGRLNFSPDGNRLAVSNQDGLPRVWDLASGKQVLSLVGHTELCFTIAYSPDGMLLATGGNDGLVKIWDAQSGAELHSMQLASMFVNGVEFSPDGAQLVSVDDSGFLAVWDVATGESVLNLTNPSAGGFTSVHYLRDGSAMVTTGYDSKVKIWDTVSGRQRILLAGHTSTVMDASISPDGRTIATGGVSGVLKTWDLSVGREVFTIDLQPAQVGSVAFSPDGLSVAAAATDGKVRLLERSTGALLTELTSDPAHAWKDGLAYSPDGAYLAAGALDGFWALWELASGSVLAITAGHENILHGLTFSPDGSWLATSSFDGTAKVWDVARIIQTGQPQEAKTVFRGHIQPGTAANWAFGVAFTPDGKLLASVGGDAIVRVWDSATGQEQFTLPGGPGAGNLTYVAISPDGKLLAAAQLNGLIRVWDLATRTLVYDLSGHSAGIFSLDFSADSNMLASASFDLLAKVWDMQTGQELATLYGNTGRLMGVAFSPDGAQVATGGEDGSLRLYAVRLEELIELARSRMTRSLTDEECQKYLHLETCPEAP